MAVTGPNTGFSYKDTNSGNVNDLGGRYVSKSYLLDAYPNIVPGRQAPGLWGCGYNTYAGLGDNVSRGYASSPIQIGSLTNWKQVACGYQFAAAVKTDGTLWAWGYNLYGQLGNGASSASVYYSSPVQVGALTTWKYVAAGVYNAMGITTGGALWAWGDNVNGQLGISTVVSVSSPVQVGTLTNWKQVAGGFYHSLAVKTDGTLWAWGFNGQGQLGTNPASATIYYSSPVQVGALTNWKQVACGPRHTAAVKTDGTLWAWGYNQLGQVGNGFSSATIYYSSPVQVGALTNWKQVACGYYHTAAVKTDGTLWAWGQGADGELGAGTIVSVSSPVQVGSLTNWKQISCGNQITAAVKTDGTLWAWGSGTGGVLGNGTSISYSSPIQVGALTTWKFVSQPFDGSSLFAIKDGYI